MPQPFDDFNRPQLYSVELATTRWEDMVRWYRDVLGLRSLIRIVEEGFAQLLAGKTCIVLLNKSDVPPPSARVTLVVEVPNVDEAAARLTEAGYAFEGPRKNEEGLWQIKLADPDGNRLMIFSW